MTSPRQRLESGILVRPGDVRISRDSTLLIAPNIAGGVAIAVTDKSTGISGLAHAQVVSADHASSPTSVVNRLIDELAKAGASLDSLSAAYAGCGSPITRDGGLGQIIQDAIELAMRDRSIPCIAKDVGGTRARTVCVDPEIGSVTVASAGKKARLLCRLRGAA